jgi:hypothetical protein
MMMKSMKLVALLLIFTSQVLFAQTNPALEAISTKIDNYFALKREAISVHFNKSTYLTNEKIWFKGYVFDRKIQNLDKQTTNVYMQVLNEAKEVIGEQLIFCFGGTFSGDFTPAITATTGVYYFRFFTNYMNNFEEDESSFYEIQFVNPYSNDFEPNGIFSTDLRLNYIPEGGFLLENVKNFLTIELLDCKNNPVGNQEVELLDQNNLVVQRVILNEFGLGKVEITPRIGESYRLLTNYKGEKIEKLISGIKNTGIVLSVNTIAVKNKCIIRFAVQEESLYFFLRSKFYILIHQDSNALFLETSFNNKKSEQLLLIDNSSLKPGVNSVRLLDENFNELSSRLIYIYPKEAEESDNLTLEQNQTENIITLAGLKNANKPNLSVSVLPMHSISKNTNYSIKADLFLNPYLPKRFNKLHRVINSENRHSLVQMDLLMSSIKAQKYKWNDILSKNIKQKYEEEIGLTIRGKIIEKLKTKSKYQVQVYSLQYDIDDFSSIDENDEFVFKNFILVDSSYLSFNLVKEYKESSALKAKFSIENNKGVFKKKFEIEPCVCENLTTVQNLNTSIRMPYIVDESVIELENIELVASKSNLSLENRKKNLALRGYKVQDDDPLSSNNVLFYLERNGFSAQQTAGFPISLKTRNSRTSSVNAAGSKVMLIIDGTQYRNYEILRDIFVRDIDEIFTSVTHLEPSLDFYEGKVVIYLKNGLGGGSKTNITNIDYLIKEGFSPRVHFKNSVYMQTNDHGFDNFGVVHWEPFLENRDGFFVMDFDTVSRKEFFVKIEGISESGELVSIQKSITLN